MKKIVKKMKGKKVLSMLLALIMVLAVCSPAFSPIIAKAASTYPVELGLNNHFIFEKWASNPLSTTIVSGVNQGGGTLTTDVSSGSFTLTKTDMSIGEIYTGHGMHETDAMKNMEYYTIPVEPNTTYSFAYNLQGTVKEFKVFVFYFDSDLLYHSLTDVKADGNGDNSFLFTTGPEITQIQFRFTICDNQDNSTLPSSSATVSNISISECEIEYGNTNLFDFDSWANSSKSNSLASDFAYDDGTVVANKNDKSITMTTNTGSSTSGMLFTSFSFVDNSGYYNIDVKPNTTYTLNYNITAGNALQFSPYIVRNRADGTFIDYIGYETPGYGKNSYVFETSSETEWISVVFSSSHDNQSWSLTFTDIELLETTQYNHKVTPSRIMKTYGEDETYGELPNPPSRLYPENYIFAGWYTGKDGTGMRITADTPVQPMSYTIYPKFEPAVDSLTVKTQPTKTVYTVGEKLDTTGLVLEATINSVIMEDTDNDGTPDTEVPVVNTLNVSSGYYCTPEVLNTVGTQTITANYGGKTVTFTVTVKENDPGIVVVNGNSTNVTIANNEYTFNYSGSAFNRYEVTYKSDSYFSGVATFNDGKTEEFFLEPSENGSFASYVDKFLEGNTYNQVVKIKFTSLNKENGHFELISLNTTSVADPGDTIYFNNSRYEMGVALNYGGVVSELYDLKNEVYARTYDNGKHNGSSVDITQVDYLDKLNENYGTNYKEQTDRVNLINTLDRGRYLQQSYYGTGEKPYVQSEYNNSPWVYNPVQGGNVIYEPSKIIDYKVTDEYVYVKARPLDWAKWSDDFANSNDETYADGTKIYEAIWGDSYITDTYVEAWYYFQGDTIKVTNRKVDYSGLPESTHSQEFPALYLIEPLNHFVYNNVSKDNAWEMSSDDLFTSGNTQYIDYTSSNIANHWNATHQDGKLINYEEPEYWGLTQIYKNYHNMQSFEPWVNVNENWAAFTASEDADSFGVGLYTETTNKFFYGVQPNMYEQKSDGNLVTGGSNNPEYRHARTINPSPELPTSYIAPTDTMLFKSYDPTEYTYYLSTGTAADIRESFRAISEGTAESELGKPKIAVPETSYLNPANNQNGQYYVNNVMNELNYYNIETEAERDNTGLYFGINVKDAQSFKISVTNATNSGNDIILGKGDGTGNREGETFTIGANDATILNSNEFSLRLSSPIQPGEKVTAKWEVTVTMDDGSTKTFVAYTVLYAPGRTVGAVAEARQNTNSQHELSSWITGANGVDHSQRAPLGTLHGDNKAAGYFKNDPLVYPNGFGITGTGETANDYINAVITGTQVDNNEYNENTFVMQTATNGHDSSRAQSYLGLLAIDGSRYTNTDQIPNLSIGYDALRVGSAEKNSLGKYDTYYTVGDSTAYIASSLSEAPSGWTTYSSYEDIADSKAIPYRESFVPSYKVSELDGKYIHAIAQGMADYTAASRQYSTAGTSVLIDVTDKSALRDSVTDGYGVKDPSDEFLDILEEAATILGDPSASQEEIDQIQKELDDALEEILNVVYALKYDNLFSMYEFSQHSSNMEVTNDGTASYSNKTLTVVNDTITATEAYTRYGSGDNFYKVTLEPNTEYVFEYDVTTTVESQAFMFFYNSSNANSEAPTNISVQTNGGAWQSKSEKNSWWGNYTNAGTYHFVIKFTTGATTTQAGFRFGNTTSDPCTSTFSNVKLIDAERYYADVEYASVEDLYTEYSSYGALPVLTRPGYTFNGWKDANGNVVTSSNIATKHESIFSQWTVNNYTITYNANGGKVTPESQSYNVEDTLTIPMPTRDGYSFQGWTVTSSDGNWELNGICSPGEVPAKMYGNVTLTAQWTLSEFTVLFDTILDFSQWNTTTASNATISNVTENGFTLTSNEGVGEGTSSSPYFTVEPGKSYKIDIDITGDSWDVYIFFCDANGNWIDFSDSENRFASNGHNPTRVFTAPDKSEVVKAQIRVDANNANNSVTFSDIRVYEVDTCASDVNVPYSNKAVTYGEEFGALPVPTREGYDFVGWYDASGNEVTADATVTYTQTTTLYSKWEINDTALVEDTLAVDFGLPATINPLDNDTVFNRDGSSKTVVGLSADGTSYSTALDTDYGTLSLSDGIVTFTPDTVVSGEATVYYQASATVDGKAVTLEKTLTITPASNVYYEETSMKAKGGELATKLPWNDDGTPTKTNRGIATDDDVYGFDNAYDVNETYSNGTGKTVTVNSSSKNSQTQTFKFKGTGIDIISRCGSTTGLLMVSVKKMVDGKLKSVKTAIVDTYCAAGTFNQTPVFNWSGDYGEYTVEIAATYLTTSGALNAANTTKAVNKSNLIDTGLVMNSSTSFDTDVLQSMLDEAEVEDVSAEDVELIWFDNNSILNGGTGVEPTKNGSRAEGSSTVQLENYIDGFRVYNPLGENSSAYNDNEKNAVYANVIENLAVATPDEELNGIAFITGNLAEGEALSYKNYQSVGPKGELYLNGSNQAVSIALDLSAGEKVMLGLRAVNGPTTFTVTSDKGTKITNIPVNSATEMYYDISSCLSGQELGDGNYEKITITNTGSNMLAVNHLKLSGLDTPNGALPLPRSTSRSTVETDVTATKFGVLTDADLPLIQESLTREGVPGYVKNGVVLPIVEEEDIIPDDTTNPDVPGDDTTGDNTTGDDTTGDDTNTDSSDSEEFSIFSLLELLISLIEKILHNAFGTGSLI